MDRCGQESKIAPVRSPQHTSTYMLYTYIYTHYYWTGGQAVRRRGK